MTSHAALRRGTVVLGAAALLTLTACGGSDGASGQSSTSSAPVSSAATAGEDVVGGTEVVDPTSGATAEVSTAPVVLTSLDPVVARDGLATAYTQSITARTASGDAAKKAREKTYAGPQMRVATAEAAIRPTLEKDDAVVSKEAAQTPPVLLAVTTKTSAHEAVVGQAQPIKGALPEIYWLEGTTADSLRITHAATMLPNRRVQSFAAPAVGSQEVPAAGDGTTPVTPQDLVTKYLAFMQYPRPAALKPAAQPFTQDNYPKQAAWMGDFYMKKLGTNGTYTIKVTLVPDSVRAIKRADGAQIVFAHATQVETIALKNGAKVKANEKGAIKALNPKLTEVSKSINLTTDLSLVFLLREHGKAELIAGSNQLIAASGS